jgi:hypothetical protein
VHKLVIVLRGRRDADELERRWSEDFVPLAEKMPGLRRVLVGRVTGSPAGGQNAAHPRAPSMTFRRCKRR